MQSNTVRLAQRFYAVALILAFASSLPLAAAQSSQVAAEWALFNQILYIGIAVGIVVFGLMFYALIKYREKTPNQGAQ
jgi:heme/copper-type cytochrome/quinol oxidase subunit 2